MSLVSKGLSAKLGRWIKDRMFEGVQHASDFHMQRKIIQVNFGAGVTFLTVFVITLLSLWVGNAGLIASTLIELPISCLLMLLIFRQHRLGHIETARLLLWTGVMAIITAAILGGQGTVIFTHGYYLVLATIAAIFSPIQRWRRLLFVVSLNIAFFTFFQIHGWSPNPATLTLSRAMITALETIMISTCAAIIVLLMLIGEYSATRNEIELQLMANTDPLTRLPNRRAFRARLKRNLEQLNSPHDNIAIAMIDIDFFKKINEEHGHDMGDKVLQLLASLLLQHVRAEDTLARYGEEEFALLLPQTSAEQALSVTERMRTAVEQTLFGHSQAPLRINISIGLANIQSKIRVDQALKAADDALYRAKQQGRNRVVMSPL
jgi:diguanylate cyclase (GGDEF)-like protein